MKKRRTPDDDDEPDDEPTKPTRCWRDKDGEVHCE